MIGPTTMRREPLDQVRAIETTNLTKRFGRKVALDGLDLAVPEGAFYLLVGPNGAGKTTALRLLLDLARPDFGNLRVLGVDPRDGPQVRLNSGYVPEDSSGLYRWMRVGEALRFHGSYYPAWDPQYADRLASSLQLDRDAHLRSMSKGQVRRVQLVMAMAHRPRLLILDEPTDGLDPGARELFLELLAEHLADSPATVLVSTHLVYEMERMADHLGVIREGRLVTQLSREAIGQSLRHYDLHCPDDWSGDVTLDPDAAAILRRRGRGRERQWMMWGEEDRIRTAVEQAGARVRAVSPVSLNDAAVAWVTADDPRTPALR